MNIIARLFKKPSTASVARERLRIIVAHERTGGETSAYLPRMQKELIAVIKKYCPINDHQVQVALQNQNDRSVLELNVVLPKR